MAPSPRGCDTQPWRQLNWRGPISENAADTPSAKEDLQNEVTEGGISSSGNSSRIRRAFMEKKDDFKKLRMAHNKYCMHVLLSLPLQKLRRIGNRLGINDLLGQWTFSLNP